MTKADWKVCHRQLRIIRRETAKAALDVRLFGAGCTEVGHHLPDYIRHIPIEKIKYMPNGTLEIT